MTYKATSTSSDLKIRNTHGLSDIRRKFPALDHLVSSQVTNPLFYTTMASDLKKDNLGQVEMDDFPTKEVEVNPEELELQQAIRNYVPNTDAEKKLVRKIDLHLIPILWIMYILNYVDRTNIVS